jgi:pyruvate formate lyase activating enzyme
MYIEKNCIKCGKCLTLCPVGAISAENFNIDREICINCGKCAEACPADAKKLVGKQVTIDEVLEEVEKDRLFYRNSCGGVTVGGGEPTMQYEFVASLLQKCQQRNIHTVMETCCYAKWDHMKRILEHLDLVYCDIKHMDPIEHMKLAGVSNRLILQNVKRVAKYMTSMIIRIPIIPGYNDSEKNIAHIAKFVASLGSVNKIELLPYHRLGEHKYEWLGREYLLKNLQPPTQEHMEKLERIVREYGLDVQLNG